ncbi:fatty acid desaturase (macronuclear) [Tetrahymena thermophila SB210]|uniref:Fatty acid desaturase n=1 Tax=Tetrahymena thermophila (strain SB210) TaxID=312017 RepID=I7LT72_TETTS|nr:fatty acid desaturase [Tetrahymena thermophila SB210]EAR84610.1 fatty acid desaturase [Tetrahymena thermophila SB210]|eukprot:XP_001032273.1 fatty acid desaturase [Tetrahymena thermophila SB210]
MTNSEDITQPKLEVSHFQKDLKAKYEGQNALLFSSLQYYFVPLMYILAFVSILYLRTGYLFVFLFYSFIPLLDEFCSYDIRNPTKEEAKQLTGKIHFKIPLYLAVVFDWLFTFWCVYFIAANKDEISLFNQFGIIFVAGNLAASNINVAHELFHKNGWFDIFMGTFTLAKNLYMHFAIEHIYGHHRNVATHKDPATSRLNQTLYKFIPQTIIGSYFSAWHYENNYQRLKNRSPINIFNKMIYYTLSMFLIPFIVQKIFGTYGMYVFLFTVFNSVFYLETVNYIEHYGLQRKEIEPGIFEKVDIHHSWNAPHRFSNYLLFKLQRHSDHHENGYKEYQTLCSYDESPTLPHGYTVCVLLSFYPPSWFNIMNKVLARYQNDKKTITYKDIQNEVYNYILKFTVVSLTLFVTSLYF